MQHKKTEIQFTQKHAYSMFALDERVFLWHIRELTDKSTHVFKKHINVFFLKKTSVFLSVNSQ